MYVQSAIDTICGVYERLSETDRKIADFILQNSAEVSRLSVSDIAKASGTSSATVSRFVRHVGYPSFSELRLEIARERSRGDSYDPGGISEVDPSNVRGSLEHILDIKVQELRSTVALLDPAQVSRVLDLLCAAETVHFAAVGNSIPVCQNMAFKLGQIGMRASCPATTESMILSSLSLRRTDLVVLVSSSGYSRRLETIVSNAEDSGTPVVMLTANAQSSLARRCDVVLQVSSRDQMLTGTQFSSHVATNFLVESLFVLVVSRMEDIGTRASMENKSLGVDKEFTPSFS